MRSVGRVLFALFAAAPAQAHNEAAPMGQKVLVTKVVIKGTSRIEFQLGGGSYGTFGAWASSSWTSSVARAEETAEEKDLKERIRQTTDRDMKNRLEKELNGLRSEREREIARAEAEAQQADEARETNTRNRRADSESRFNIRFRHGMPADALTPDGVMRALETYLEFSGIAAAAPAQVPAPTPTATKGTSAPNPASADAANGARGLDALRKELSVNEVDHIPGPAATAVEVQEGLLLITKRTYSMDGMRIAASFVSGVMVDLSITPQ